MQSNQPLLTIAIPTYNRERCLEELLSILEIQALNEQRLEIIVSDNASTDDTEDLARAFVNKRTRYRYIRNKTNLGPDANILQCFNAARGKYVWIFGDDDILVPDALRKIMGWLELGEYDLVYIQSFNFNGLYRMRTIAKASPPSEIDDVRKFTSYVGIFLTFISGNIVNKNKLSAHSRVDFDSLIGTCLVQLGWTFAALNNYECGLYVSEPLVGARADNTGGYKVLQCFGPTLKQITTDRLFDKALQRLIINSTLMRFWPAMLINYTNSISNFESEVHPREILGLEFRENIRYWIFVYPILMAPVFLAKSWLLFTRVLNKLDKVLGYPLMR